MLQAYTACHALDDGQDQGYQAVRHTHIDDSVLTQAPGPATPTAMSVPSGVAPAEVDHTLARLTANPAVRGVLVLDRPRGYIIRAAGPAFDGTDSAREAAQRCAEQVQRLLKACGDEIDGLMEAGVSGLVTLSLLSCHFLSSLAAGLFNRHSDPGPAGWRKQDDLRFLRLRTKRHELMVTPGRLLSSLDGKLLEFDGFTHRLDEKYILVVVQVPPK